MLFPQRSEHIVSGNFHYTIFLTPKLTHKQIMNIYPPEEPCAQTFSLLRENYDLHKEELRDIVANDHFGGEQHVENIVDQWVAVMEPGSMVALPANIKGFYGGSLRASIPIEVARGSYKYIIHETSDIVKVERYARRMLIALSVIDIGDLVDREPVLGAAALWHRVLAEVRLPDCSEALETDIRLYEGVRNQVNLPDSKMPQPLRLKARLESLAKHLGNRNALSTLETWEPCQPLQDRR